MGGTKKRRHGSLAPSSSSSKLASSSRKVKKEASLNLILTYTEPMLLIALKLVFVYLQDYESTPEDQKDENTSDAADLTRTMDDPEPPNRVTQVAPGTPVNLASRNSRTSLATADLCKLLENLSLTVYVWFFIICKRSVMPSKVNYGCCSISNSDNNHLKRKICLN